MSLSFQDICTHTPTGSQGSVLLLQITCVKSSGAPTCLFGRSIGTDCRQTVLPGTPKLYLSPYTTGILKEIIWPGVCFTKYCNQFRQAILSSWKPRPLSLPVLVNDFGYLPAVITNL